MAFAEPVPLTLLVPLAAVTLVLDAVDGWVARRTTTGSLGAHFDGLIAGSLDANNSTSRAVANSLGAAMLAINGGRGMDGRTMVNHMSRALHEWDADGAIWGARNGASEIPFGFAKYAAEAVAGPNIYGAHTTRRVHKMLELLGVRP